MHPDAPGAPGPAPAYAGAGGAVAVPPGALPVPPAQPSKLEVALSSFWKGRTTTASPALLGGCVAVGVASGVLLVGNRPGLGMAVAGLLLWLPAVPVMVRRRSWADLALAALSVALVAVVAVRDAEWVVGLSVVVALCVGAVAATGSRTTPSILLSGLTLATAGLRSVPWLASSTGAAVGGRRGQLLVVTRTLLVTVVLLVVFGLLFAGADGVFASLLPTFELGRLPGQVVVAALALAVAGTLAHLALAPPAWGGLALRPAKPAGRAEWLAPLVALDALFLVFLAVQLAAAVGGADYVRRSSGLTYAEYARQGFGQLLVATLLTLLVVAVAARKAPWETARDRVVARVVLGVLCLSTLGVVVAALTRMSLYVDAFGLTRLRLLATAGELALGVVVLLVVLAGVRWKAAWFPRAVTATVGVAMLALAAVNPDAQILRYNVAAAEQGADLDVYYLTDLSQDAQVVAGGLDGDLRECLVASIGATPAENLAEWNLGRQRATEVTDARPADSFLLEEPVAACADAYDTSP
jgi:hypothetical protein